MEITEYSNLIYSADRPVGRKQSSILKGTALFDYVQNIGRGDDAVVNYSGIFQEATRAFENECAEVFGISRNSLFSVNRRYEYMRPFIIKILLFLDVFKRTKLYAAIAYIIEKLAIHPETDIAALIDDVVRLGFIKAAVTRAVENCFDIYDDRVAERIEYLTDTKPVTAKDALYDIALFVRTRFYGSAHYE